MTLTTLERAEPGLCAPEPCAQLHAPMNDEDEPSPRAEGRHALVFEVDVALALQNLRSVRETRPITC